MQAANDKLEWKNAELEKAVVAERKRLDTMQTKFLNQICVKNGLYGVFAEPTKAKPVEELPIEFSPSEDLEIRSIANQLQVQDAEKGDQYPLQLYIDKIKENPEAYIKIN